jgi:riboflavin kinase / FMN adenylyltransferase
MPTRGPTYHHIWLSTEGTRPRSLRLSVVTRRVGTVRVWHDTAEIDRELGPSVVTIGNFDGVHRGHRHVLAEAGRLAGRLGGLPVVAVTFDPHPMTVIRPDKAPEPLTSVEDRTALLAAAGADAVLVLSFTPELADQSAEVFAEAVVFGALHAAGVVVGENFRFGHRALGDVALLRTLGREHGAEIVGLPLDGAGEHTWSSTYIRTCLASGDVRSAAEALGRQFSLHGRVVRGDQRGRELGYPTANVPVSSSRTAVPADGVYAGWLRRLDRPEAPSWPAAISVGTNPTFDGTDRRVESYVLDRTDLELYDDLVEVVFVEHLRGMVKFDSVGALVTQMKADVDACRNLLVGPPGSGAGTR